MYNLMNSVDTEKEVPRVEQPPLQEGSGKKRKKVAKAFTFANYPSRKIALRIAYHGHVHDGLSKQDDTENTIETIVCNALKRLRLIPEAGPENFGRCGRTDKGVSALGNCFSFIVRASCSADATPQEPPLDYCNMLNHILPPTVRIVGFALVDNDFDARFSCVSRSYRYYFCHRGLDLEAMRRAASYFLGKHNFRNFCKMDVVNVSNFDRDIMSVGIYPSELLPEVVSYFEIKANSFLYHQIRCTMEVLFLVGRGLEEPEVVKSLLERGDAKPIYPLADGTPLVLWDCAFHDVQWQLSHRALRAVERELQDIGTALLIRASAAASMRSQVLAWYAGTADEAEGKDRQKPVLGSSSGAPDAWSATGCDWTHSRTHDALKVRRADLFREAQREKLGEEEAEGKREQAAGLSSGSGSAALPPKGYVKLLDRETERTYEEEVTELSQRKRARYDANEVKKAAGAERYKNGTCQ